MRAFKLISALVVVLAFTAVAASTASAAETLWELLPGLEGETFTAKSGAITVQEKGGLAVKCQESSILLVDGVIVGNTHTLALAILHLGTKCTAAGLAFNSLGDPAGFVLKHVEIHTCIISTSPLVGGLLIKLLPLHLEVPSVKLLIEITGSFVAPITPNNEKTKKYKLDIKQTAGVQSTKLCLGGSEETLLVADDAKAPTQAGLEATNFELNFDNAQEAMI